MDSSHLKRNLLSASTVERGYITFDELNEILPEDISHPNQIEEIFNFLGNNSIEIVTDEDGILRTLSGEIFGTVDYDKISNTGDVSSREDNLDEHVALAIVQGQIKIVSISKDGNYQCLDENHNIHNIFYATSNETLALKIVIEEFEDLVNNSKSVEADFQDFFKRNPDFILNNNYKSAHSHIILSSDDRGSLIPDFILEPVDQDSLCDILEIKLPKVQTFTLKKNRTRFSAAVFEACSQLREYSCYFDEEENRKRIFNKYGLLAYKPKLYVILGRRGTVSPIIIKNAQEDLPGFNLISYDQIIDRMKYKHRSMMKKSQRFL